jgi:hypothetical protein
MRTGSVVLVGLSFVLSLSAVAVGAGIHLKKPKHGFQMKVGKYTVAPGQDLEVCEYRRLPNRKPMDVSSFSLRMPAGAHHFVIWAYGGNLTDASRFPKGPVPSVGCTGVSPDEFIPQVLIPIQTPNARFEFPPGIALPIDAHEQVWLNPHMRNGEPEPIVPDIRFNFYRAKKGTVVHHAQGLIVGNSTDIDVPAGGDQTITAEWTAPVDLTLIELATHQHRLGTYANIELVDTDGVTRSKIYENTDWQHPHSFWPQPAIHLTQGQKMRITCTWHNTDAQPIHFGPKTTDEMCFILGFYYRDGDATGSVVGNGCIPSKRGLLCPFAPAVTN